MPHTYLISLMATALLLAGSLSISQAAPHRAGICKPSAAAALTGRNRISNRTAKRPTDATIVRQIRPGQGVTMDYRRERVTIETNPRTGKIVRAFCG